MREESPDRVPQQRPPELVLIGTVHHQRQGEASLRALLERLQPAEICLEFSSASLEYRRTQGRWLRLRLEAILERLAARQHLDLEALQELPSIRNIRELLELPFEYRAASAYADPKGIALHLIDSDSISARKLERVERSLISYRNIRTLVKLAGDGGGGLGEGIETARRLLQQQSDAELRGGFLARRRGEEGVGPRDALMAAAIRRRMVELEHGLLVHVGGWVHLVEDPRAQTLFSRLSDLGPRRLLLGSGSVNGESVDQEPWAR